MGQPLTTEAFVYKSVAKHQQGDLRGVEKGYRKILRHAPNNVATLINLGIILKDRGDLKQAKELFSDAVELAPDHADGHTNLGDLHARLGKKYRAISCYRAAACAIYRREHKEQAMDWYHIWCDLKPGEDDRAFCTNVDAYLGHLTGKGLIAEHRLMRRKLGLAHDGAGEFHIMIGTRDLAQLDQAFSLVSTRAGEVEGFHKAVYSAVTNLKFALYRDFPDT